jgi:hypothetical protein
MGASSIAQSSQNNGFTSIAQSSQNNGFTQSKYNTHQQGQRDGLHTHKKKNIPFQDHKVQIFDG